MTRSWPARTMAASPWAAIRTLDRWVRAVRGSPRFNRALPPRAATTSMSGSQGGDQHRLDGVHAVFRLIKNDRGGAFENLVGLCVKALVLPHPTALVKDAKDG